MRLPKRQRSTILDYDTVIHATVPSTVSAIKDAQVSYERRWKSILHREIWAHQLPFVITSDHAPLCIGVKISPKLVLNSPHVYIYSIMNRAPQDKRQTSTTIPGAMYGLHRTEKKEIASPA